MPRHFEDYEVGDETMTPARTIFEADVVNFFYLSGDQNEAHSNIELARARGEQHTAVQWNLVFSLVSGLLSRSLFYNAVGRIQPHERPEESAWAANESPSVWAPAGGLRASHVGYHGFHFVNLRPVRVGDTIHAHVRVGAKLEIAGSPVIRRDVRVFNQHGELVQEGWHEMESPRRPR